MSDLLCVSWNKALYDINMYIYYMLIKYSKKKNILEGNWWLEAYSDIAILIQKWTTTNQPPANLTFHIHVLKWYSILVKTLRRSHLNPSHFPVLYWECGSPSPEAQTPCQCPLLSWMSCGHWIHLSNTPWPGQSSSSSLGKVLGSILAEVIFLNA